MEMNIANFMVETWPPLSTYFLLRIVLIYSLDFFHWRVETFCKLQTKYFTVFFVLRNYYLTFVSYDFPFPDAKIVSTEIIFLAKFRDSLAPSRTVVDIFWNLQSGTFDFWYPATFWPRNLLYFSVSGSTSVQ